LSSLKVLTTLLLVNFELDLEQNLLQFRQTYKISLIEGRRFREYWV